MADISTIGQHWQEQLSGFRVYRRGPGESEFTRLPQPFDAASKLTVLRPTGTAANAPVRYSFTDTPPGMGEYEYYVTGWSEVAGQSGGEAAVPSNHVTATMDVSLTDTTPPVWDSTAGITSAVDNGDGTVTIEWGTATDIAVPPAPASPPVSYNIYYSTESPIDYANAGLVAGQTGTSWTSGALVTYRPYYFAVRTVDGADPANEDENTNELSVEPTGAGGVNDWDPPLWMETFTYDVPGQPVTEYEIMGIKELNVGDGRIYIACAEAMDELSPPVHYDLYYLDLSKVDDWDTTITDNEGVEIIRDIPMEFELEWPNRKGVAVCVRARDSSADENLTKNRFASEIAPTRLQRIPVDLNIPGADRVDLEELYTVWGASAFDRHSRTKYIAYYYRMYGNIDPAGTIWILAMDMETGEWTLDGELTYTEGMPEIVSGTHLSVTQEGDPWLMVWVNNGAESYDVIYRRNGPGDWRVWDVPDIQGSWGGDFAANGLPVFYVFANSDVNPGKQWKLYYRWWDESAGEWRNEFVCDPAGSMTFSTVRPDGVVQLSTVDEATESSIDLYCHVLERSVDGTWTEIFHEIGKISLGGRQPYWGEKWAWASSYSTGNPKMGGTVRGFQYGTEGYSFIEHEDFIFPESGAICLPSWPAEGGGYHTVPERIYRDGEMVQVSYDFSEFTYGDPEIDVFTSLIPMGMNGISLDMKTGWFAILTKKGDGITANCQVYLYTCGPEDSMYELEW